ncbi:hypothetical protein THAOC_23607, partial [Thalassiosira oceanica]
LKPIGDFVSHEPTRRSPDSARLRPRAALAFSPRAYPSAEDGMASHQGGGPRATGGLGLRPPFPSSMADADGPNSAGWRAAGRGATG